MKIQSIKSIGMVCLVVMLMSACGLIDTAKAFSKVGNDFMSGLKNGDYEAAYALFHPALQENIGTVSDLQTMIESNAAQPEDWSFSSMNATTDADQVTTATVEGTVTYQDGKTGTVTLELILDGEAWLLTSFSLNW